MCGCHISHVYTENSTRRKVNLSVPQSTFISPKSVLFNTIVFSGNYTYVITFLYYIAPVDCLPRNTGATAMPSDEYTWTLFSNYAHVLICLATDSRMRLRDVATQVGITERAAQRIVTELEQANILSRERDGRRNRYLIHTDQRLRHPLESHCTVGALLKMIARRTVR